jgi:hypothetical protein
MHQNSPAARLVLLKCIFVRIRLFDEKKQTHKERPKISPTRSFTHPLKQSQILSTTALSRDILKYPVCVS